jgi:hypothetical protein
LRARLRLPAAVLSTTLVTVLPVASAQADANPARIFGSHVDNLSVRLSTNSTYAVPNFDSDDSYVWSPATSLDGRGNDAYDRLAGTDWVGTESIGNLRNWGWTQYTANFDLPSGTTTASGFGARFLVDNEVREVTINGHAIGCSTDCGVFTFPGGEEPGLTMLPAAYLKPRDNELKVAVVNIDANGQPSQAWDAGGLDFAVDQVGPTLTAPDVSVDATSSAGVHDVDFPELLATTADGADSVDYTCDTDPADNTFPIGDTDVECSATDAGFTTTKTFTVSVTDAAPTLSLPDDITTDATSTAGAFVHYAVHTTDAVDGDDAAAVSCDPASASAGADYPGSPGLFEIGTTTVHCTATDSAGNETDDSFTVTVVDQAPTLTLPDDAIAEATSPTGADVTYDAPTAADEVDGDLDVTCVDDESGDTVQSGDHFPIGTTQVDCSTHDSHGNVVDGDFLVTVRDTTAAATTDDVSSAYTAAPQPVTLTATDAASESLTTYYATGVDPSLNTTPVPYGRRPISSGTVYDPAHKPTLADGERIAYATYDGHGNLEATKRSGVAHVDASVPDTTITSAAKGTISTSEATFAFAGSLPTAMTYECKFEGASFGPCTSPDTIDHLSEGVHTFVVRAISRAGVVDPTPATETFTVKFASVPIGTTPSPEAPRNAAPATTPIPVPTTVKPVLAGKHLVFIPGSFGVGCAVGGDTAAPCTISVVTKAGVELASGTSKPAKGSVAVGLSLTDDGIRRLGKTGKPIPVRIIATAFGSTKVTGEISSTLSANTTITVQLKGHGLAIGKAAKAELAAAGVALDGADSIRCIAHTDDAGASAAADVAITEKAAKAACALIAAGASTTDIASRGAGHDDTKRSAAKTRRVVVQFAF